MRQQLDSGKAAREALLAARDAALRRQHDAIMRERFDPASDAAPPLLLLGAPPAAMREANEYAEPPSKRVGGDVLEGAPAPGPGAACVPSLLERDLAEAARVRDVELLEALEEEAAATSPAEEHGKEGADESTRRVPDGATSGAVASEPHEHAATSPAPQRESSHGWGLRWAWGDQLSA